MRLSREDHENLLNELLNGEIEHTRRTEILQSLRLHDGTLTSEFENISKSNEKLQKEKDDLVVSNSMLFRQIGVTGTPQEKEVKEKEFSETITLEALEKQNQ